MKKFTSIILSVLFALSLAVPVSAASDADVKFEGYNYNNEYISYITLTRTPVYLANDTSLVNPTGYLQEGIKIDQDKKGSAGYVDYIYFTAANGKQYKLMENLLLTVGRDYNIADYTTSIKEPGDTLFTKVINGSSEKLTCTDNISKYINIHYYHSNDFCFNAYNRPSLVVNNGVIDVAKSIDNYNKSTYIVKNIVKSLNLEGKSELQKLYAIEDYVASMLSYGYNSEKEHSYEAIECLYKNAGNCGDYASSVQLLCQEAGIKSVIVLGRVSNGAHAWNRVCIDGKWYAVDVCWYDYYQPKNETYRLFNDANRTRINIISNI